MFTLRLVVPPGAVNYTVAVAARLATAPPQPGEGSGRRGFDMITKELELRRLALVLAGQLPSDLHEARLVVTMLQTLVDNFLADSFEAPPAKVIRAPTTRDVDGGE
jgi:hypothetical protein